MDRFVTWDFPLPRTHTGIMFGNARMGVLAWGAGRFLKLTLGRADLWDHRGGMPPWSSRQNLKAIRRCLEAGDEAGMKEIFACATEKTPGQPLRPSVVPVGRFDIDLGEGSELVSAKLDLKAATARVEYIRKGEPLALTLSLSMDSDLLLLELAEGASASAEAVPSWRYLESYFRSVSFPEPELFENGWHQAMPADPGVCALHRRDGAKLWIATARSVADAKTLISGADESKFKKSLKRWWGSYWKDVPALEIPNATLSRLYWYGLYKFAAFTNPSGVPASLQGPWIEEYEMPPWSSDYHFNINVQMCYWPACRANKAEHLLPLFNMVWSWRETLRANAKAFVGIDDGYMLPHAVDDRCVCMGSFWTGIVDHACAAWIAQMMCDYYRYSLDLEFLKGVAFPFMKGVMRVYEEMLERDASGRYHLPLGVSPEYRGAAMDAWGRDASFQLAAIHRLLMDLDESAALLGETLPPSFAAIREALPKASLIGKPGEERIALWDGTDLEESHRHHSHLGAISPFETIDPYSPEWKGVVARSVLHWIEKGMGKWTGWCVPWASMLHSRLGNGAMAELLLEICERVFANKGHGTLHDPDVYGFTCMGGKTFGSPEKCEVMQMDAAMGMLTAVQEIFLHVRGGVVHVLPAIPPRWRECSLSKMPAPGGFLLSAKRANFKTVKIEVESAKGGTLRFASPWNAVKHSGRGVFSLDGSIVELRLGAGDSACFEEA